MKNCTKPGEQGTKSIAYLLIGAMMIMVFEPVLAAKRYFRNAELVNTSYLVFNNGGNQPENGGNTEISSNYLSVSAIPGGPDQPEPQGFTPIGVSDMVDPFTGDFSYNIPLLDIDGYPINLAYTGNVGMSSESSWVGLGWSVNPGAVNRSKRGVPDDFNGTEKIETKNNTKPEVNLGLNFQGNYELFGFGDVISVETFSDVDPSNDDTTNSVELGIDFGVELNFSNYTGMSTGISFGPSFSFAQKTGLGVNSSLGVSGNSQAGPSLNPQVGFTYSPKNTEISPSSLNIGSTFSSRRGWQSVNFGFSMQKNHTRYLKSGAQRKSSFGYGANTSLDLMQSTYIPSIGPNKFNGGFTFTVKLGPDLLGNDFHGSASGSISIADNTKKSTSRSAYGHMYLSEGQSDIEAILDFNRENGGGFSESTPSIGIPVSTYDLFNVSGQGVSGSYFPFMSDIPIYFDPLGKNNSVSASLGAEIGAGGIAKSGVDVSGVYNNTKTGNWVEGNAALGLYGAKRPVFHFRDANEMSIVSNYANYLDFGEDRLMRFRVRGPNESLSADFIRDDQTRVSAIPNSKTGFNRSNQTFVVLTHEEIMDGAGLNSYSNLNNSYRQDHHIGAITVTNKEGKRYVYGIAAYNIVEKDFSFAVGNNKIRDGKLPTTSQEKAFMRTSFDEGSSQIKAPTEDNNYGIDHYYNQKITPSYAHSYLLTDVLSDDYIDNDGIRGASPNDYGTYYHFEYKKVSDVKWRNPVEENTANYQPGLYGQKADDKAHFSYGEKEIWYVQTIESKNQIAVFFTSFKKDGFGVQSEYGGLDNNSNKAQHKLDRIELYNREDYDNGNNPDAIPIKTVVFEYDYTLCPNYENYYNPVSPSETGGKLTLVGVHFEYEGTYRGKYNGYKFSYGDQNDPSINPEFNPSAVDRWGNYKPVSGNVEFDLINGSLHPTDYPYVNQDYNDAQSNTSAWMIREITLPSGGKISIDYESDSYAFVQHKRAMVMCKIVGVEDSQGTRSYADSEGLIEISSGGDEKNKTIIVDLGPVSLPSNPELYYKGIDYMYFRAAIQFARDLSIDKRYDFVPGWAEFDSGNLPQTFASPDGTRRYMTIPLVAQSLKDNEGDNDDVNPITAAGISFGRMYLSNFIPPSNQNLDDNGLLSSYMGYVESLIGAFTSLGELATGPNKALYNKNYCKKIIAKKSYVRLYSGNPEKFGGGCRVKRVVMTDAWDDMVSGTGATYGQEYFYVTEGGITSGVAAYEPEAGGDENPWKQPVFHSTEYLGAPNEVNYQELPFGSSFFPSPNVGYSRVVVQSLSNPGIKKNSTGKVVNEFYTAKDFPTIAKYSSINQSNGSFAQKKHNVGAIFYSRSVDYANVSQGFVVENNDMHGKPKATTVYEEEGITASSSQNNPVISSVEYIYKTQGGGPTNYNGVTPEGMNDYSYTRRLTNEVTVIHTNGSTGRSSIGMKFDVAMDFRENKTNMHSGNFNTNLNVIPFTPIPIFLGKYSEQKTQFRSSSLVKTINRFGVLAETIAVDLGSRVSTQNLAYDAETGDVLLTKTKTNFEDDLYSLSIPAHWYYESMGLAYKNAALRIDRSTSGLSDVAGGVISGVKSSYNFRVGDELYLYNPNSSSLKVWISGVSGSKISIMNKDGIAPVAFSFSQLIVLRSARRNMQSSNIETIVSRTNPLNGLKSNVFENVLQASAIEFSDDWRLSCGCLFDSPELAASTNPYFRGEKGRFKPKASYSYLTSRIQAYENKNSNLRDDGFFESFNPFYENTSNRWQIDRRNWTFASDIRDINSMGQAVETVDALNRYTSTLYSFNKTLPSGIAVNTRIHQIGEESFEDEYPGSCESTDFNFIQFENKISSERSHTGKNSIKVSSNESNPKIIREIKDPCDVPLCALGVEFTNRSNLGYSNGVEIKPVDAQGQVTYEVEMVYGELDMDQFDSNGNYLIASDSPFKVTITIRDGSDCVLIETIER